MRNRFDEALLAFAGWSERRVMSDKCEPMVSERMEVVDDPLHATPIVDMNVEDAAMRRGRVVENHWNPAFRQFVRERWRHLRNDDRKPGNPSLKHGLHTGDQLLRAVL